MKKNEVPLRSLRHRYGKKTYEKALDFWYKTTGTRSERNIPRNIFKSVLHFIRAKERLKKWKLSGN